MAIAGLAPLQVTNLVAANSERHHAAVVTLASPKGGRKLVRVLWPHPDNLCAGCERVSRLGLITVATVLRALRDEQRALSEAKHYPLAGA